MKLKFLIFSLIAVFAVFGVYAGKEKHDGNAIIKFSEQSYNFGTIKEANGPVSYTFEFINTGNGNLVIIDATAECGCTRPEYPKNPIAPGKKGKIKVTYNPAGRPGSFDKVVTVRTNGSPKKVRLKIKGSVVPK
ncbi:MAG: DUF1573 domain-containing protein [Clostridium sp.]|nr:DUF1573 domain-containing protein [Prevotella sp.]MCM1429123.1 DUF1573 domain-containing protein [Clostridium sp.]MCM1475349.1 DUF1573 domain-containing protein [Muribaculaceae bacterium]